MDLNNEELDILQGWYHWVEEHHSGTNEQDDILHKKIVNYQRVTQLAKVFKEEEEERSCCVDCDLDEEEFQEYMSGD